MIHKIIGIGHFTDFNISVNNKPDLLTIAQDVWDNPHRYINKKRYTNEFLTSLIIQSEDFPHGTKLINIINVKSI